MTGRGGDNKGFVQMTDGGGKPREQDLALALELAVRGEGEGRLEGKERARVATDGGGGMQRELNPLAFEPAVRGEAGEARVHVLMADQGGRNVWVLELGVRGGEGEDDWKR